VFLFVLIAKSAVIGLLGAKVNTKDESSGASNLHQLLNRRSELVQITVMVGWRGIYDDNRISMKANSCRL
jgi:hypothetical protein